MTELISIIFDNYTFGVVALGSIIIGAMSGTVGTYAVLKKQSLIGDTLSHAMLPGIVAAFLITGIKSSFLLMVGASFAAFIANILFINILRYTKLKSDASMAIILSIFFGFGILLLSYLQKQSNSSQAGIEAYIFGQAATMLLTDVKIVLSILLIIIIIISLFWKEFKIVIFDFEFASTLSLKVKLIDNLISFMIVLVIVSGLQAVGVILMSALLVGPAVAARQYTDNLVIMILLSSLFGAVSGYLGTYLSSSFNGMPTGPTIIVVISLIVALSLLLAPHRGILRRKIDEIKNKRKLNIDAVLSDLYNIYLQHPHDNRYHEIDVIKSMSHGHGGVEMTLNFLKRKGLVIEKNKSWKLTEEGIKTAKDSWGN